MMSYSPGDSIISCNPFVHILSDKQKSKRCDYCVGFNGSLKACAKCKCVFYCDLKCQNKDWRSHRRECAIYAKYHDDYLSGDDERLMLRLWLMMDHERSIFDKKINLHDGTSRCFNDMMTHLDEIKLNHQMMTIFEEICSRLIACEIDFNSEQLMLLFCRYYINAFMIGDEYHQEVGTAIYLKAHIFDHSCSPNAKAVFNGIQMDMRAIKHITPDEPIYINYMELKTNRDTRRNYLHKYYYFDCGCNKCESKSDISLNYSLLESLDNQFNDLIMNGNDWTLAYSIGLQCLPLYKAVYGDFHPEVTLLLMKIVKIAVQEIKTTVDVNELEELLLNTQKSISITHGDKHPLANIFIHLTNK